MTDEPRARILIVDDDADHNDLERDAILGDDDRCSVAQAYSAQDCLEAVAKSPFDLVIMDYTLPDTNGLELMQQIKEMGFDFPVLMVTGHGDEGVAVEAMKQGAYDYLIKTPDQGFLDALPLQVRKVLKQHGIYLEKSRLEEKVRETKEYLEKIISNAGDAVLVLDPSGRVLSINPAGHKLFGKKAENLSTKTIFSLVKDEADCENLKKALDSEIGETNRIDIKMRGAMDRTLEVSVSSSMMEIDEKPQSVVIMRDMTEMLNMQRQLVESEKLAAIGDLVGSVAHELNNKLGPILGYAELMQRSVKDEKTRQRLRVIEDSALRAKSIIEALLGFSRHRKPLRSLFKLNKVLQDALSLMEFQLKRSGVDLELQLGQGLPEVFADSVQVQQIFVNLLKNAYQAVQPQDHKTIWIKTFERKESIFFSIRDSGVGVPEAHLNRVFEPFFTTRKFGKGVGLGLSVAYGMIKEHNGDITLNSKEHGGTEVTVKLPIGGKPTRARSPERRAK